MTDRPKPNHKDVYILDGDTLEVSTPYHWLSIDGGEGAFTVDFQGVGIMITTIRYGRHLKAYEQTAWRPRTWFGRFVRRMGW